MQKEMTQQPKGEFVSEFAPGTLWQQVLSRTEHAQRCGAIQPLPTEAHTIEQAGVQFLVRQVKNLVRKDQAKAKQSRSPQDKPVNPFLPHEENLFVTNLSATHFCLLNKFNVIDHHLLLITRSYEDQENLLTLADFAAASVCLAEIEGLVFYNAGQAAGASQPHKHLQLLPLPLTCTGPSLPITPLLETAIAQNQTAQTSMSSIAIGTIAEFSFHHAFVQLRVDWQTDPLAAAQTMLTCYKALLQTVGIQGVGAQQRQSAPYNLLMTRDWMLLVPRSQASSRSIAVNSVGFAGMLLVRTEQQMQIIQDCGPLTVLAEVALPIAATS